MTQTLNNQTPPDPSDQLDAIVRDAVQAVQTDFGGQRTSHIIRTTVGRVLDASRESMIASAEVKLQPAERRLIEDINQIAERFALLHGPQPDMRDNTAIQHFYMQASLLSGMVLARVGSRAFRRGDGQ